MGFNTNVSISNDFWHEIQKNPQALVDAITRNQSYGNSFLENRTNRFSSEAPQGVVVHRAKHYDDPSCVMNVGGFQPFDVFGWRKELIEKHPEMARQTIVELQFALKWMLGQCENA